MSELTQCNYCSMKAIKADAKRKKMKVVVIASSFMGGKDVFVVPPDFEIRDIRRWKDCSDKLPNGDKNYQKYHAAWMMEIGNHCEC